MARPCLVCNHPERAEIDAALVSGKNIPTLIREYPSVTTNTLQHHKSRHLKPAILEAQLVKNETASLNVTEQLGVLFSRVTKLFNACDRWLQDPANVEEYSLEPREDELQVIYTERRGGVPIRRKAPLSTLLARLDNVGVAVLDVENRSADMRELTLKTAKQLQSHLEFLARLTREIDDSPKILNVVAAPEWLALRSTIITALAPYPEARQAVIEAIRQHDTGAQL